MSSNAVLLLHPGLLGRILSRKEVMLYPPNHRREAMEKHHSTLKGWLNRAGMTGLSINAGILGMEFKPQNADRDAAWEMYVELLTRIATQPLPEPHGDEGTALESVFKLFEITRQVIKRHGWRCIEFTKIAVVVLNQIIRPFTARWHRLSLQGAFDDPEQCVQFRQELAELQTRLRGYNRLLAEMAGVEDLTGLEEG